MIEVPLYLVRVKQRDGQAVVRRALPLGRYRRLRDRFLMNKVERLRENLSDSTKMFSEIQRVCTRT